MKFAVQVLTKEEVLDTQGRALGSTLREQGFRLKSCHVGKYFILDVDSEDESQAMDMAKDMAKKVLHNPLIEEYKVERLSF